MTPVFDPVLRKRIICLRLQCIAVLALEIALAIWCYLTGQYIFAAINAFTAGVQAAITLFNFVNYDLSPPEDYYGRF